MSLNQLKPGPESDTDSMAEYHGDIVIIVDPNGPRNQWPKGRVIATYRGRDNQVREATIQTFKGIYRRSVVNLALLDLKREYIEPTDQHTGGEC